MVYKWKPGARISISAQEAGNRIEALRNRLGRSVTRADVLEDAEDTTSPLHEAFEWDDSTAANQHRLAQASHILNCLIVVRIKVQHPDEERPRIVTNVRAFHPVVQNDRRGYETTARILNKTDLRNQLLTTAIDELDRFRQKYRKLRELVEVFAAIEAFKKTLRMPRKRATHKTSVAIAALKK